MISHRSISPIELHWLFLFPKVTFMHFGLHDLPFALDMLLNKDAT